MIDDLEASRKKGKQGGKVKSNDMKRSGGETLVIQRETERPSNYTAARQYYGMACDDPFYLSRLKLGFACMSTLD